jgi:hypothetical protein
MPAPWVCSAGPRRSSGRPQRPYVAGSPSLVHDRQCRVANSSQCAGWISATSPILHQPNIVDIGHLGASNPLDGSSGPRNPECPVSCCRARSGRKGVLTGPRLHGTQCWLWQARSFYVTRSKKIQIIAAFNSPKVVCDNYQIVRSSLIAITAVLTWRLRRRAVRRAWTASRDRHLYQRGAVAGHRLRPAVIFHWLHARRPEGMSPGEIEREGRGGVDRCGRDKSFAQS